MGYGFVIVRHVNNDITDQYWKESYRKIRQHYPDHPILIVDDNSSPEYLREDLALENCQVVSSEYPARGEILGYYYFHKLRPFETVVVIHDSVFINSRIDFSDVPEVRFLWSFLHYFDEDLETAELISKLDFGFLVEDFFYRKDEWFGCFGVMSAITWEFLDRIDLKYRLLQTLIENTEGREQRKIVERVFACVCTLENKDLREEPSYLGFIEDYSVCKWGTTFEEYQSGEVARAPLIKIWTGR